MSVTQFRLPNLKDKFKAQREAEEKAAWAEKAKKEKKVGINSKKKIKK